MVDTVLFGNYLKSSYRVKDGCFQVPRFDGLPNEFRYF